MEAIMATTVTTNRLAKIANLMQLDKTETALIPLAIRLGAKRTNRTPQQFSQLLMTNAAVREFVANSIRSVRAEMNAEAKA
jgi:hypothetical protein